MMDLLDPATLSFLLGFAIPLFVYTTRGARPNSTNNRLARSSVTSFLDSLLSDDGTNVTVTSGQLLLIDGTTAAPSLSFSSTPSMGLYRVTSQNLVVVLDGVDTAQFQSTLINIMNASGSYRINADTILSREAAATFQQGLDSATPVNQTFKGPDGSGTDIAGGDMTAAPGRGTGTGAGGSWIVATAPAGTTGSAQNALVNRMQVESTGGLRWLTGTKPTCASGIRGTVYYVAGAATVLDTFEVCRKDTADAYAWVTLF